MKFQVKLTRVVFFAIITWLLTAQSQGQGESLYLLSGMATQNNAAKWASILFRLGRAQTLNRLCDIVSPDAGLEFMIVDADTHTIVLGYPPLLPHALAVFDMNSPTQIFSYALPAINGKAPIEFELVDVPEKGLGLAEQFFGQLDKVGRPVSNGLPPTLFMTWLRSRQMEKQSMPLTLLRYAHLAGYYGTAGGFYQRMYVRIGPDESLTQLYIGNLGILAPQNVNPMLSHDETYVLAVNNREVAVLQYEWPQTKDLERLAVAYILNKATGVWHQVSVLAGGGTLIRGFGHWVAGLAVQRDPDHLRESAGKEIRQAAQLKIENSTLKPGEYSNLTVEDFFAHSGNYYPGELFLYNAKTGQRYQISTGQGDSEVLLATDDAVYYRVNDSLFRARIGATGLEKAELLAKDPSLFQIHWAFLSSAK